MSIFFAVIAGAFIVLFGILVLFLSLRWLGGDELSSRIQTYVVEEERQMERWSPIVNVRTRELSGSMLTRILNPWFKRIAGLFGRLTPASNLEEINHKLYIAGNPMGMGASEFYGLRLLFTLLGMALAYLIISRGLAPLNILGSIMAVVLGLLLPTAWLQSMVRRRQNVIRKGLPDALDMLSVCADAGLGFDQSLQRVSEHWRTPVAIEFGRVVSEMEMGLSRREALRNLADRLEVTELSSFVAVLLQSDQLGMSIADTLHSQAEQMRVERRFRAQEQARTIPIKMLIPLAFFIFPAIMAVLLGPSLPPLIELFSGF
jgi:tight adherence protein C